MKSKLIEMREKYPQTELWTDSFHIDDHAYGLTPAPWRRLRRQTASRWNW